MLVDLVDRGERGPGTAAALEHLAICHACERETTEAALTVAALRRAGMAYRALEVPDVPRRAARAAPAAPAATRRPWAWRLQLGGLLTSAALAALLVAPRVGPVPAQTVPTDAPATVPATAGALALAAPPAGSSAAVSWRAAEHRLAVSPDVAPIAAARSMPPRYPEGLLRPRKEVSSTDAAARELEPS